ncbi:MAG: peroxiredoxin [Alphaproteobacteria bacterium HGW-Alphaproteobacteria-2]|nr:MAG: peroxiredoxin [Alphaproteobacteria bacterium HGW-Alphaproteobacteria-2]
MPETGDMAPDFTLPKADGGEISLAALRPGAAVVYFYPRDDTPGCTREAIDFTSEAAAFAAAGVTVIGISKDTVASHAKFAAKHGLGVVLASDAESNVCERYGVWVEKSMYGRKSMGVERATFLIDGAGRIAQVWRKVKVPGHVAEVLAAAHSLGAAG